MLYVQIFKLDFKTYKKKQAMFLEARTVVSGGS